MKFKKIILASLLGAAASAGLAGGFDGTFVQLGLGSASGRTAFNSYWDLPPNVDTRTSDSSFVGQLAAGYSRSFGAWNLAASVSYSLGDHKTGNVTLDAGAAGTERYDFKNTNTWGISLEPGYNLSDSTLLYAKLGYSQTAGKAVNNFAGTVYHYDANYSGLVYGVGAKYRLTPNLYGLAELHQTDYRRNSFNYVDGGLSLKPDSLIGLVGIGYRF